MQGLQAQPPVTTPLHGYVQLGCSEDTLLINLLFFCIVILDTWKENKVVTDTFPLLMPINFSKLIFFKTILYVV